MVEISSTCLLPRGKKSGHSHMSPVSTGFTRIRIAGATFDQRDAGRSSGAGRARCKEEIAPPLFLMPEPRMSIQLSPSRQRQGSRKPVTARPAGGAAMTGSESFFQVRRSSSSATARHCVSRQVWTPSRRVASASVAGGATAV